MTGRTNIFVRPVIRYSMKFFYRHRVSFGFICLFLALAFTVGVCCYALTVTSVAETRRFTVVLDAGHGGIDGGVVGINTGMKESDVNLSLTRILAARLEDAGLNVVLTRKTEAGLYGAATSGYKRRDMKARAEVIKKNTPALVISVHQNFFSLHDRRGAQVFYRKGFKQAKTLACLIQTSFNEMEECVKKSDALVGDYYILNCSDYPSVITECGFLSNAEDEKLLVTKEYQEKIAAAITVGVLSFLSLSASGD